MSRPVKRSLTLHQHRTSVTLEDEFWQAFRGLATASRLSVLAHYRAARKEP